MAVGFHAIIFGLWFSFGLSQVSIPGSPACAVSCINSAVSAAGCALSDLGCQCGPTQAGIALIAGPCLLGACNTSDLASLSAASSAVCSSFAAGLITTLPQNAVSTTSTSRVTTTPTPVSSISNTPTPPGPAAGGILGGLGGLIPPASTAQTTKGTPSGSRGGSGTALTDEVHAEFSQGTQAAIAISGAVSATFGAGVLYFILWNRKRKRRELEALVAKEVPPVEDLAGWIRDTGGDEKKRYTAVDLSGKLGLGPQELDAPAAVYELPGTKLRHEVEGSRISRYELEGSSVVPRLFRFSRAPTG